MKSKKSATAVLHPSRETIRYRIASNAILASFLAMTALLSGKEMRVGPDQQSTESAESIKPAGDGVLDLFKQRAVVALGNFHWLAQEESFYCTPVRDPRFAGSVGNVVVEFGGKASQGIIDR
jgi:hypothetical protein